MSLWNKPLPAVRPLLFILASAGLTAADKLDLSRITPVPATEPVPIMDFFRPRLLQQPKLNPSGTHIAAIVTAGEGSHELLVYELKTQKIDTISGVGDKDIYQVTWLNDTRLVFELSARKLYGLGLIAADLGSFSSMHPLMQYYGSSLIAVPPKNRLRPLVWNRHDFETNQDGGVAVVNTDIRTGRVVDLVAVGGTYSDLMDVRDNNERHIVSRFPMPSGGVTYGYLADREGQLAYAFTSDNGRLAMKRLENGQWLDCPVDLEHINVVDCGDQPGQVVVIGPRQEGQPRALQMMDAATGKLGEVLLQDKAYDFTGWLYRSPATQEILGVEFERNGPRTVWFSEDYRKLQKILDGFFPGVVVRIIGNNEAGNLFLVATYSDRQPAIYSWVNIETGKAGLFKNSAPWIDPKRMQPESIVKFKTRDGRQLDAYLTLPAGASKAHPPPLVVVPHGGPWMRDDWGFDGEAQFLASRGYAVLKPNYRGSPGYNWMFPEEDEWDFRKMHDDVTDATKGLIASGLIDGGRVAIMGGSFGGYLAVSGIVNEPSLYRCAVTIAGVFDWEKQINDSKYNQYDNPTFGRLMHKLGDPKQQREKFDAISPGRHADQIRVPVFVAGGKEDPTVDIEQARGLISALEKYHVPHETDIVGEEGHGMGHLDNQVELYSRIEAFLDKYLKPAR
jgi:dipeptidyl aminopeptidase/acylaminoacyl peptidase